MIIIFKQLHKSPKMRSLNYYSTVWHFKFSWFPTQIRLERTPFLASCFLKRVWWLTLPMALNPQIHSDDIHPDPTAGSSSWGCLTGVSLDVCSNCGSFCVASYTLPPGHPPSVLSLLGVPSVSSLSWSVGVPGLPSLAYSFLFLALSPPASSTLAIPCSLDTLPTSPRPADLEE